MSASSANPTSPTGDAVDLLTSKHQQVRRRFSDVQGMRASGETAEKMAPTHPHAHGPTSAVGNLVVGPFVAVADTVGDALRGNKAS